MAGSLEEPDCTQEAQKGLRISVSEAISIMIRTILRRSYTTIILVDLCHTFGFDSDTLLSSTAFCAWQLFTQAWRIWMVWANSSQCLSGFFYFCSFICFLSLISEDQTWKLGFQGGSILQQDFQGTCAVQNLFSSGEQLWDQSVRQVNDLSGVPKLERLMLKVPASLLIRASGMYFRFL